jgi:hypothetical protein
MNDVAGVWDVELATPIGRQKVELRFAVAEGGTLAGEAVGARETVELQNLRLDGDGLRWEQSIRYPIRLNLAFSVRVVGDRMTGEAKAGPLPPTAVTGTRRSG